MMRVLFVLVLLVMPISVVHAQTVNRVDITEYGIYKTTVAKQVDALGTAAGKRGVLAQAELMQATSDVPALLGVKFGFRYKVVGKGTGPVTLTQVLLIPAPGLRNPATGNVIVRDSVAIQKIVGSNYYTGYTLSHDWELVPGTWTMELWAEGRKLASKSFNLVKQ